MRSGVVHVVDDDPAVLRSLDRLLRLEGYETKLYDSAIELLDDAPDSGCVLADIKMPGMDGIEFQQKLRGSGVPVILMTGHGDVGMAVDALKAGAIDFLEKPFSDERLFDAIDSGLGKSLSPSVDERTRDAAWRIAQLSPREREVLDGLVQGEPHKIIAHKLGISVRTVELHRVRMLHRLGTRHLADAIRLAVLAELSAHPDGSADA
jgi:two-component system response regulator FixJ